MMCSAIPDAAQRRSGIHNPCADDETLRIMDSGFAPIACRRRTKTRLWARPGMTLRGRDRTGPRALLAILAALAFATAATSANAQSYPSRVIKLVVPYTAGSPNDVMARLLTQNLQGRLGQPIVIDNKPGGGTAIGTRAAAAADPDGYTLLFISSAIVIDPAMKHVAYDPFKEFTPVGSVNTTYWLITVSPSLPAKTLAEFVAYTKAHPGTTNFAATQGTAAILVAELFKQRSGADVAIIPYKGGAAALPDFLGGRIQVLNPTPSTSLALIRAGKMRPLLITSPTRVASLPDVPTAREVGLPDLTLEFWAGVMAPAGTPPDIVGKLNAAINDTLRSPEMKDSMAKLGMEAKTGSPQDFAAFIKEEAPRWTAIVKTTGVKLQ
jgi:tripartite-type tricarboxylate transporter receptor subunit TctC